MGSVSIGAKGAISIGKGGAVWIGTEGAAWVGFSTHPLNKKRENIEERVLKGKLFKNSVQQSNSPTTLYFLKCNSLLYSSIYSFLNYIYIQHTCCFVGCCWIHCWTCFQRFSKNKKFNPTKSLFVGRVGRPPTLF